MVAIEEMVRTPCEFDRQWQEQQANNQKEDANGEHSGYIGGTERNAGALL